MEILREKAAMRAWTRSKRAEGLRIGFVPTMGYLHEGHLSLVRRARELADVVVVSIYVNPTQFAPGEDLDIYPRDEQGDLEKLEALGCDAVFAPAALYDTPDGATSTWVTVEGLTRGLCGRSRPTFFRGVTTVVSKLFNVVEPDLAVFGKKDYQQWRTIERMSRELDFGVEIVGMPIVREPDGLAMSSRNVRLDPDERRRALSIVGSLSEAERAVGEGAVDATALVSEARERIGAAGGRVDYVELVDARTLEPIARVDRPALLAIAAHFGTVRLIDNRELFPPA